MFITAVCVIFLITKQPHSFGSESPWINFRKSPLLDQAPEEGTETLILLLLLLLLLIITIIIIIIIIII